MLAGRRDVEFLDYFNSKMKNYSDDGETFNAAYGHRARRAWGFDQLARVVQVLIKDTDTRQAVVQLWDPNDLGADTVDKACNMSMVFQSNKFNLDLTVYNRSNDLVYGGVTGANPVHFSYFQQYVADTIGLQMGTLTFVSTNAHVYTELYPHWERMDWCTTQPVPRAKEFTLGTLGEVELFCKDVMKKKLIMRNYESSHLNSVIKPLMNYWIARKEGFSTLGYLESCECPALRWAGYLWQLERSK
jgi:thymidylate synthase